MHDLFMLDDTTAERETSSQIGLTVAEQQSSIVVELGYQDGNISKYHCL